MSPRRAFVAAAAPVVALCACSGASPGYSQYIKLEQSDPVLACEALTFDSVFGLSDDEKYEAAKRCLARGNEEPMLAVGPVSEKIAILSRRCDPDGGEDALNYCAQLYEVQELPASERMVAYQRACDRGSQSNCLRAGQTATAEPDHDAAWAIVEPNCDALPSECAKLAILQRDGKWTPRSGDPLGTLRTRWATACSLEASAEVCRSALDVSPDDVTLATAEVAKCRAQGGLPCKDAILHNRDPRLAADLCDSQAIMKNALGFAACASLAATKSADASAELTRICRKTKSEMACACAPAANEEAKLRAYQTYEKGGGCKTFRTATCQMVSAAKQGIEASHAACDREWDAYTDASLAYHATHVGMMRSPPTCTPSRETKSEDAKQLEDETRKSLDGICQPGVGALEALKK